MHCRLHNPRWLGHCMGCLLVRAAPYLDLPSLHRPALIHTDASEPVHGVECTKCERFGPTATRVDHAPDCWVGQVLSYVKV